MKRIGVARSSRVLAKPSRVRELFSLKTAQRVALPRSCNRMCSMHNEFTAIIERDGEWFIAQCPEVSEANGQGRTPDEAKSDLAAAIRLVLEDRREDALKAASPDAVRDMVTVGS